MKDNIIGEIIEYVIGLTILMLFIDYSNPLSYLISKFGFRFALILFVLFLAFILVHIKRKEVLSFLKVKTNTQLDKYLIAVLFSLLITMILTTFLSFSGAYSSVVLVLSLIVVLIIGLQKIVNILSKDENIKLKKALTLYDVYSDKFELNNNISLDEKDIQDAQDDLLNRELIVRELTDAMQIDHNDHAFTIGLEGEWGSGKTSVINMAKAYIERNINIKIIDFDPWYFGNEEAIVQAFYKEILNAIGIKYDSFGLKQDIKRISSIIAGATTKTWITKLFDDYISYSELQKKREELERLLNDQNNIIVIIIDNLDRIDDKHILFLFKLISTFFDLPHTNYVLSYDEKRLDDIFNNSYKKINPKYKEKIINKIIRIPETSQANLKMIYTKCIENVLVKYNKAKIDDISEYINFLSKKVKNLRNFIRIMNSNLNRVFFYYENLDLNELLILELLRFRNKFIYEYIKQNQSLFVMYDNEKNDTYYFDNYLLIDWEKDLNKILDGNHKSNRDLDMVLALFPKEKKQERKGEITIRSAKYFGLYFTYGSNYYLDIVACVNQFIKKIGQVKNERDIESLANKNSLFNMDDEYHSDKLDVFENSISKISKEKCIYIIDFLWNKLIEYYRIGIFDEYTRNRIEFIIEDLILHAEFKDIDQFIKNHSKDYRHLGTIYKIERYLSDLDSDQYQNIKDKWDKFYKEVCSNIQNGEVDLYNNKNYSQNNIEGFKSYLSKDEFKKYIQRIKNYKYVYRILGDNIKIFQKGSNFYYSINEESFFDFGIEKNEFDNLINRYNRENDSINESQRFVLKLYESFKMSLKPKLGMFAEETTKPVRFENL